jgi:hypothetical protein
MSTRIPWDELDKEFDRIGADQHLRTGLASTDPRVSLDLVLAARGATPTGAGTHAFEQILRRMLDDPTLGSSK